MILGTIKHMIPLTINPTISPLGTIIQIKYVMVQAINVIIAKNTYFEK